MGSAKLAKLAKLRAKKRAAKAAEKPNVRFQGDANEHAVATLKQYGVEVFDLKCELRLGQCSIRTLGEVLFLGNPLRVGVVRADASTLESAAKMFCTRLGTHAVRQVAAAISGFAVGWTASGDLFPADALGERELLQRGMSPFVTWNGTKFDRPLIRLDMRKDSSSLAFTDEYSFEGQKALIAKAKEALEVDERESIMNAIFADVFEGL